MLSVSQVIFTSPLCNDVIDIKSINKPAQIFCVGFIFIVVLFCLWQSDIIAFSNSGIETFSFSDILFALKLAKQISLCVA